MSNPKRQHFVPQFLLRNFTDDTGHFFVHDRRQASLLRYCGPADAFVERHIYSSPPDAEGNRIFALEKFYAEKLESDAAPVISDMLAALRKEHFPVLEAAAENVLLWFIYHQWKRTPTFHRKVAPLASFEPFARQAIAALRSQGVQVSDDEEAKLLTPEGLKHYGQLAKVIALGRGSEDVIRHLRRMTISHAILAKQRRSFVIGSMSVVTVSPPALDLPGTGRHDIWMPLSRDVAMRLGAPGGRPGIIIPDMPTVRRVNLAVLRASDVTASESEKLLHSLINAR